MAANTEGYVVDRSKWLPGPWDNEVDRVEWESHGFPCLLLRHQESGHWCGYVAVPPGHPCHGKEEPEVSVHGGITYSGFCYGNVCHVPKPGEPDDVFWFGFDAAHGGDLNGFGCGLGHIYGEYGAYNHERALRNDTGFSYPGVYRTQEYMRQECESLASQLAALATGG